MRRFAIAAVSILAAVPASVQAAELTAKGAAARAASSAAAQKADDKALVDRRLAGNTSGIVNGRLTTDYPAVGVLLRSTQAGWEGLCSGTLVGCSDYATAAHCVSKKAQYAVFFPHAGFFDAAEPPSPHPQYAFPVADVAMIRLSKPVDGLQPIPFAEDFIVGVDEPAIIVGLGRRGGNQSDFGIKRRGGVTTVACQTTRDENSICWNFLDTKTNPGDPGSNTCNGDSGAPVLVRDRANLLLGGIVSGGVNRTCTPIDHSYNTRVSKYAAWMTTKGSETIGATQCGRVKIGSAGARFYGLDDVLTTARPLASHTLSLSSGVTEIRIGLNGYGDNLSTFALEVLTPAGEVSCTPEVRAQFAYCKVDEPDPGTWKVNVMIDEVMDPTLQVTAIYQLVATVIENQ